MKHVVPVAIGLAAGLAVGFFLGAMVTRHDEPIVVIHNATDETLRSVSFQTDFHPSFIRRIPMTESYGTDKLQPHQTFIQRLSSRRPTGFKVDATTAGGKRLSSEKVYVAATALSLLRFPLTALHCSTNGLSLGERRSMASR